MNERKLNDTLYTAFKKGELKRILDIVKADDTLDLELRGSFANIYYRGGSLFKVFYKKDKLEIYFNENYCKGQNRQLKSPSTVIEAVENVPLYKYAMDLWFKKHPKLEREFQQIIVRENNNIGKISRSTDYYIIDIEYANKLDIDDEIEQEYENVGESNDEHKSNNARFDMVALKWLSDGTSRKKSNALSLALIEVKYGDGALKNNAGVNKHLEDFNRFLTNEENLKFFCKDMTEVFKQKCELGLVDGIQSHQLKKFEITPNSSEVIFIFANHDPDSQVLDDIIKDSKNQDYSFPIMIANSSNMGYCLYSNRIEKIN